MGIRKNKQHIYRLIRAGTERRKRWYTAENVEWRAMAPAGWEFGSPDLERLVRQKQHAAEAMQTQEAAVSALGTKHDIDAIKAWGRLRKKYLALTAMERHQTILTGIPSKDLKPLFKAFHPLTKEALLKALGCQPTVKATGTDRLPLDASDAFVSLLEVTEAAQRTFGDRPLALQWLSRPALALDGQVPLALIATRAGVEALKTLLDQMEYGVYL
jgi:putative toxin-antitoxin system antitoxin component (TIGR02293 family)